MAGRDVILTAPEGTFGGYLSLPPSGTGPGLVVIQEIFGVNKVMRDLSDMFAAQGFVALCPDLFWRIEPGIQLTDQTDEEWAQAFDLFGKFDKDKGVDDIAVCLDYLRGLDACSGKAGTVGYCLGGFMAYVSSTRTSTDGSVGYYGVGIQDVLDEATNIKSPLMLHIAEEDEFVPKEAQSAIADALSGHAQVTLHSYAGMDHAFARQGGAHYDKEAADQANNRTFEFLHGALG